jgi:general secretion pathway protein D
MAAGESAAALRSGRGAAAVPVTLDFPSVEIEAASRAVAAILDRPILVDPRVKGLMTLYSAQPVSPTQAYLMYLNSLRGLGYALVSWCRCCAR